MRKIFSLTDFPKVICLFVQKLHEHFLNPGHILFLYGDFAGHFFSVGSSHSDNSRTLFFSCHHTVLIDRGNVSVA